jgi:hypothetical protein
VVYTSPRGAFSVYFHIILEFPGKFSTRKIPPMGVFAAQMERGTSHDNIRKKET